MKGVKRGRELKFALVVTANVRKAQMKTLVNYREAYRRQRTDSGDTRRQGERVKRQETWKKEAQRTSVLQ